MKDENEFAYREEGKWGQKLLISSSLSKWPCFLETFMVSGRAQEVISYFVLTLEPFHNLLFHMSKLVNSCSVRYLSSDKPRTGGHQRKESSLLKYKRGYS